jgi:hypothetical protein
LLSAHRSYVLGVLKGCGVQARCYCLCVAWPSSTRVTARNRTRSRRMTRVDAANKRKVKIRPTTV